MSLDKTYSVLYNSNEYFNRDPDSPEIDVFNYKNPQSSLIELSTFVSLRFSMLDLTKLLKSFIKSYSSVPIQMLEAMLYKACLTHQQDLNGKLIDSGPIEKMYHLKRLISNEFILSDEQRSMYKVVVEKLLNDSPAIVIEYELSLKILEIFNGLLVKWKLGKYDNYDYRYSGRCLNVKLLDLNRMNKGFFSVEIIWISTKLRQDQFCAISTPYLLELAEVLKDQFQKCIRVFLNLNPNLQNAEYNIDKVLAFNSKEFYIFSKDVIPEENLHGCKHAELTLKSGVFSCFLAPDPELEGAYCTLKELELAYRTFEKELISTIIKTSNLSD